MEFFIFVQVLDCFFIVLVLVFLYVFLKVRYECIYYFGVLICLVGIVCLVVVDYYGFRYYGLGEFEIL